MLFAFLILFVLQACRKNKNSDNSPNNNPTKEQLTDDMLNAVLDMRLELDKYFDVVGIIGRDIYRFSPTEQRYTTDLLGAGSTTLSNNQFYITDPWRRTGWVMMCGSGGRWYSSNMPTGPACHL